MICTENQRRQLFTNMLIKTRRAIKNDQQIFNNFTIKNREPVYGREYTDYATDKYCFCQKQNHITGFIKARYYSQSHLVQFY